MAGATSQALSSRHIGASTGRNMPLPQPASSTTSVGATLAVKYFRIDGDSRAFSILKRPSLPQMWSSHAPPRTLA
jgi:hypothetical protein